MYTVLTYNGHIHSGFSPNINGNPFSDMTKCLHLHKDDTKTEEWHMAAAETVAKNTRTGGLYMSTFSKMNKIRWVGRHFSESRITKTKQVSFEPSHIHFLRWSCISRNTFLQWCTLWAQIKTFIVIHCHETFFSEISQALHVECGYFEERLLKVFLLLYGHHIKLQLQYLKILISLKILLQFNHMTYPVHKLCFIFCHVPSEHAVTFVKKLLCQSPNLSAYETWKCEPTDELRCREKSVIWAINESW